MSSSLRDLQTNLAAALQSQFALFQAKTAAELFDAKSACFLPRAEQQFFRFGNYLDVKPTLLVYNPIGHGAVGLVSVLDPQTGDFGAAVRNAIEEGVQVRQVFLEEAQRQNQRALQLEVVLMLPTSIAEQAKNLLAEKIYQITRETEYLRLIGLNVFAPVDPKNIQRAELRRAFSWLLCETGNWFAHIRQEREAKTAQAWTLALDNYRLQGQRKLSFSAAGPRLHLVHGHNGSGKSSLVEALELLLTQRIERLEEGGETVYFSAVGFRGAGINGNGPATHTAEASLILEDNKQQWNCTLTATGQTFLTPPASEECKNLSFRIDQRFMNDLIRCDQFERAKLFVKAFAPNETEMLAKIKVKEEAFQTGWQQLPSGLKPLDTTLDLAGRLHWTLTQLAMLASADTSPAPDTASLTPNPVDAPSVLLSWEQLLPIAAADLTLLAQLRKGLAEQLKLLRTQAKSSVLGAIDAELNFLLPELPRMLDDLRTTVRIMEEFADWEAMGQIDRGLSFEDDLQRWLELKALADLSAKYYDVVASMQRATELGWLPSEHDALALPPIAVDRDTVERVQARKNDLARELNDAGQRLRSWQNPNLPTATPPPEKPVQFRRFLKPGEEIALNTAGVWITSAHTPEPEPLGKLFRTALTSNQGQSLLGGSIGYKKGLQKPIEEGKSLIDACERLKKAAESGWISGTKALQNLAVLVTDARELQTAREGLSQNFLKKLAASGPQTPDNPADTQQLLLAAINELLALMTPARWAYRDIELKATFEGDAPLMTLNAQDGGRADLMLNTAELSAFTLVLFLLLAPRMNNPLKLLVLDDPLQNMDEMMVTTLARALANLVLVYPEGWSILALFHGQEDVERISDEADNVLYFLPWLKPFDAKSPVNPEPEIKTHLINLPIQRLNASLFSTQDS